MIKPSENNGAGVAASTQKHQSRIITDNQDDDFLASSQGGEPGARTYYFSPSNQNGEDKNYFSPSYDSNFGEQLSNSMVPKTPIQPDNMEDSTFLYKSEKA